MKQLKPGNILNILLLVLFIAAIAFATIRYTPTVTALINNPEKFRFYILSYGDLSISIFLLFQVLQVVVATIPGELMQIAGGYIYGTLLGTAFSSLGIMLGSVIVYFIARFLGFNIIKLFVSQDKLDRYDFLFRKEKTELILFLLFLIPGLPKDILTYLAGLTSIQPVRFFIIATVARFPGILISTYVGANLQQKEYSAVMIALIIALFLLLIGLVYKDKLLDLLKQRT